MLKLIAAGLVASLVLVQSCLSLSAAQPCTTFTEGQRVEVQGRIVQYTMQEEKDYPIRKVTELVLDKPICWEQDGEKITSIEVGPVSKKWRDRRVVITGDMEAGDSWGIDVKKIAAAEKAAAPTLGGRVGAALGGAIGRITGTQPPAQPQHQAQQQPPGQQASEGSPAAAKAANPLLQGHVTDTPWGQVTDANRLPDYSIDSNRYCGRQNLSGREPLVCASPELRALWQEGLDLIYMLGTFLNPAERDALVRELENKKMPCDAITVNCARTRFQTKAAWLREQFNRYKQRRQQAEEAEEADAAHKAGDYKTAFKLYLPLAKRGYARAQATLVNQRGTATRNQRPIATHTGG